jgi:hypothetical protein
MNSRLTFVACAMWMMCGCSSSDADPVTTTDSGTAADTAVATDTMAAADSGSPTDTAVATDTAMAADTPADSPASCTPIANVGTSVTKASVAGAPPAMTGGTIVPGTYVLTKFELYMSGTGTSVHKETMEFGAGTMSNVTSKDGSADKPGFFTYATAGDTITLTQTCGGSMSLPLKYTATATTFVLVAPTNPNQVQTYTKK